MSESIQSTIQRSLDLKLFLFKRGPDGFPHYHLGFFDTFIRFPLTIYVKYPSALIEEHNAVLFDITNLIQDYINEEQEKINRSILVDNDDQFFRNMVPPHQMEMLNNMFSETCPVLFTQEISPIPVRLNLPILVGIDANKLLEDLRTTLHTRYTSNMPNLSMRYNGIIFNPVELVTVHSNIIV